MRTGQRKSTPQVKGGKVQKKNDWGLTPNYYSHAQRDIVIDRKRPGAGYRHLLKPRDIRAFIAILPDWGELSVGLDAVVLAPGERNVGCYTFGYHSPGVVHICAWELGDWDDPLWHDFSTESYHRDKAMYARWGVPCEPTHNGYLCKFTEATVRAHQLLQTLLHELGHHHDRMTTKSQTHIGRGEPYAEAYALRYEAKIWERYQETFELY